jgi:hypothetical protein
MRTTTDTDRLGDEIAELAAHLRCGNPPLADPHPDVRRSPAGADQGALSCAHWLSGASASELGAAREHRAHRPRTSPTCRRRPRFSPVDKSATRKFAPSRASRRRRPRKRRFSRWRDRRRRPSSSASVAAIVWRCGTRRTSDRGTSPTAVGCGTSARTDEGLVRFDVQLGRTRRQSCGGRSRRRWQRAWGRSPRKRRRRRCVALMPSSRSPSQYLAGGTARRRPIEVVRPRRRGLRSRRPDTAARSTTEPRSRRRRTERLLCDASVVEVVEDSRGHVRSRRPVAAGGRFRRCSAEPFDFGIAHRRFSGMHEPIRGRPHVVPWARDGVGDDAREPVLALAGGITRTSTSTRSAWSATARAIPVLPARRARMWGLLCRAAPALAGDPTDTIRAQNRAAGIVVERAHGVSALGWAPAGLRSCRLLPGRHDSVAGFAASDRENGGASPRAAARFKPCDRRLRHARDGLAKP